MLPGYSAQFLLFSTARLNTLDVKIKSTWQLKSGLGQFGISQPSVYGEVQWWDAVQHGSKREVGGQGEMEH